MATRTIDNAAKFAHNFFEMEDFKKLSSDSSKVRLLKEHLRGRLDLEAQFLLSGLRVLAQRGKFLEKKEGQDERNYRYAIRHKIHLPEVAVARAKALEERARKQAAVIVARGQKARAFDRMVEALDAIKVGDKFLGDCTGSDLLRAAVELEIAAKEATAQSAFYRQLAAIVGKTNTVREASDRAGIVGLLTQFKEAA